MFLSIFFNVTVSCIYRARHAMLALSCFRTNLNTFSSQGKHWIYSLLNDNQNQSPVLSLLRIEIEVSLKLRSTSVLKCSEDYGQIHLSALCVPTMLCYSNWIFTAHKEQCSLIHTSQCSLRLTAHQICAVWIQMFVYPLPSQPVPI